LRFARAGVKQAAQAGEALLYPSKSASIRCLRGVEPPDAGVNIFLAGPKCILSDERRLADAAEATRDRWPRDGTRTPDQRALDGDQLLVASGKVRCRPDLRMQYRLGPTEQLREVRRDALS